MIFSLELKHRHAVNKCTLAAEHISNGLEILFGSVRIWTRGLPHVFNNRLAPKLACHSDHYAPSHYLNQWWPIINWTLGSKIQWNVSKTIFLRNECEHVCKTKWKQFSRPGPSVLRSEFNEISAITYFCLNTCTPWGVCYSYMYWLRTFKLSRNGILHEMACTTKYPRVLCVVVSDITTIIFYHQGGIGHCVNFFCKYRSNLTSW